MKTRRLWIAAIFALAAAGFAEGKFAKRELKDRVEIPGTVVCIGCTLENQEGGADPQCTLYAKHAQGLQLADGTIWSFVDNARGHYLITTDKMRGKEIKVLGWRFAKAQYLEVFKFAIKKGDAWEGWDFCKTCGWEPGDHHDKDLCDDCAGEGK